VIRFVDLTEALGAGPACAIYDTVVDRFDQRGDGSHCLENLDDVREAAGERGVALVPAGFFDGVADPLRAAAVAYRAAVQAHERGCAEDRQDPDRHRLYRPMVRAREALLAAALQIEEVKP